VTVLIGDCRTRLAELAPASVQCCVTSPPYWGLRDYGVDGQIGLESSPAEYVEQLVGVFREVRRVLRDDGVLWLNLGDSYIGAGNGEQGAGGQCADRAASRLGVREAKRAKSTGHGLKSKDLVGIPWRVAFALQADGWWLRCDVVWAKPSPMPESVTDRPTRAHEFVFLLAKSERYFYDAKAIAERAVSEAPSGSKERKDRAEFGGVNSDRHQKFSVPWADVGGTRNARSVWTIASQPYSGAHFATMPPTLVERCIMAGSRIGDTVLDPFLGSGTTGMVAEALGRRWIGCELNPDYAELIKARTAQRGLLTGAEPPRGAA
jgi:DNA modification methylase